MGKLKAGIFDGPKICELIKDSSFKNILTLLELLPNPVICRLSQISEVIFLITQK